MIQQMHEQHVELGADVDVNYIRFHGLVGTSRKSNCNAI